jgi:ketosteroid isomerase-like protein
MGSGHHDMHLQEGQARRRDVRCFDAEIENDAAVGSPTLHLERLVEEGDSVVAVGHGEMTLKEAGRVAFVFAEVFTFTGDKISRLETFHINLGGPGDTLFTTPAADEASRRCCRSARRQLMPTSPNHN